MKKENVKRFWNEHKNTIKKAVILVTVPAVLIGIYVATDKIITRRNKEIFELLENGYIVRDEA